MLLRQQRGKLKECHTIEDMDTLKFFQKQKRGGICQVGGTKYAKANNKYMRRYDKKKDSNYIMYLDANNLYGWAMMQKLPYKIIGKTEKSLEELLSIADDGDWSYCVL